MGEAAVEEQATEDLVAKRKQDIEGFINGFSLTPEPTGDKVPEEGQGGKGSNAKSKDDSGTAKDKADSGQSPAKEAGGASGKKGGKKTGKDKELLAAILSDPEMRKTLARSRVQATVRFPTLLMYEYDLLCKNLGIEGGVFNEHMEEALTLWIDKKKKAAPTLSS